MQSSSKSHAPYLALFFALIIGVFLRLPSLRWPVISDDEGIYFASAQVIHAGGTLYRDTLDIHPPGVEYTYALARKLLDTTAAPFPQIAMVHLLGLFFVLFTLVGLWLIAREILPEPLWALPPLLYGIVSATKGAYDGLAVNGELLMNLPTVLGVWLLMRAGRLRSFSLRATLDLLAAFFVGVAGLYKWQALATGLAFPWLALSHDKKSGLIRTVNRRGILWIIGVILPLGLTAWAFSTRGALEDFLRWGFEFNRHYIKEGTSGGVAWALHRLGLQLASIVLPSLVVYGFGLMGMVKAFRSRSPASFAVAIWTVLSFFCIALGGRFFGHYFLQAELPLSLLAAEPLAHAFSRKRSVVVAAITIPALFFFVLNLVPSWTHALFDPGVPDWQEVGAWIQLHSNPGDTLFVWGNAPPLYYFSERKLGTRFSYCNYLTGLSPGTPTEYKTDALTAVPEIAWPLLVQDFTAHPPTLVFDTAHAGWKGYGKFPIAHFPTLAREIQKYYQPVGSYRGAILYHLKR